MKNLFIFFVLAFNCLIANSTNYYVSANGLATNAGTISSPWNIAKMNSFFSKLLPGDSVLFKCGDMLRSKLLITKSGTAAKPIVISCYGVGPAPVFYGLEKINTWVNIGGNIWQSSIIAAPADLRLLTVGGSIVAKGRWPNINSNLDSGYIAYTNWKGIAVENSAVTVNSSVSIPANFVGGKIVIKPKNWTYYIQPITSQVSNVISFSLPSKTDANPYTGEDGAGFFIQDHPATLDAQNEWYFDVLSRRIQMYSTVSPATLNVQYATLDTLINLYASAYITIEKIKCVGANSACVYGANSNGGNIKINNCCVDFSGKDGITLIAANYSSATADTVTNCLASGIMLRNYSNGLGVTISKCVVSTIANIPGMDNAGDMVGRAGITGYSGSGVTISGNTVTRCGFVGVEWWGTGALIENNYITYFANVKDDAGGIYCYNGFCKNITKWNSQIRNNIITNGIGAPAGAAHKEGKARGIYLDEGTNGVTISGNLIADMPSSAFHGNTLSNILIRQNAAFNCKASFSFQRLECADTLQGIRIFNNTFYPFRLELRDLAINSPLRSSAALFLKSSIAFDSNRVWLDTIAPIRVVVRNLDKTGYQLTDIRYSDWIFNYKVQMNGLQYTDMDKVAVYYNSDLYDKNTYPVDASSISLNGTTYCCTISLDALTWDVLREVGVTGTRNYFIRYRK